MKAVLTGSTGYIGSRLHSHLQGLGWDVRTIGRGANRIQMVELFRGFQPDIVFHLASLFIAEHKPDDVEELVASNVTFGSLVVDSMIQAGVRRLVNTGTSWQHFGASGREPVSLYAATKSAFEEILRFYVAAENLKCVTLTIFDSFGPSDWRPKLIPKLVNCFDTHQTLELSPGDQKIDFVHVVDIVRAYVLAAERLVNDGSDIGFADEFALSSGNPIRLRDLVALIERIKGGQLDVRWGARPYRKREVMVPWAEGQVLPGWRPSIDLETGLRELMNED